MTWPARILLIAFGLLAAACGGDVDWDARLQEIITGQGLSAEQHIAALEAYVDEGPPLELASEARFTIGWVYAESLHQYTEAHRWFNQLLEEDPEGAWAENARWMNENMEKDDEEILQELRERMVPPGGEGDPDTVDSPPPRPGS
jgi:hypothetical protein